MLLRKISFYTLGFVLSGNSTCQTIDFLWLLWYTELSDKLTFDKSHDHLSDQTRQRVSDHG